MDVENVVSALAEHGAVGLITLLAIAAFGLAFWVTREQHRNHDMCNARVERLIQSHIDFVAQTARDISGLTARIEHMLDRMERVVLAAKECVEARGNGD